MVSAATSTRKCSETRSHHPSVPPSTQSLMTLWKFLLLVKRWPSCRLPVSKSLHPSIWSCDLIAWGHFLPCTPLVMAPMARRLWWVGWSKKVSSFEFRPAIGPSGGGEGGVLGVCLGSRTFLWFKISRIGLQLQCIFWNIYWCPKIKIKRSKLLVLVFKKLGIVNDVWSSSWLIEKHDLFWQ